MLQNVGYAQEERLGIAGFDINNEKPVLGIFGSSLFLVRVATTIDNTS